MPSVRFRRRWIVAILVGALVTTGGLAYAAIPDAGGVIHTCYTKSSGAWRVIDTGLGQSCKANEAALDLYSKGGADLAFLGKTATAADSDKLDGQDSSAFLGATAKAADSDKFDGLDSWRFVKGFDTGIATDFSRFADGYSGFTTLSNPADGAFPGLAFDLTCDADGVTTLVARSQERFSWWWDDTSGEAVGDAPPYSQSFELSVGVEAHSVRVVFTRAWFTTTVDLDSLIGNGTCALAWTHLQAANASPGP